jgi:hypothetical protein
MDNRAFRPGSNRRRNQESRFAKVGAKAAPISVETRDWSNRSAPRRSQSGPRRRASPMLARRPRLQAFAWSPSGSVLWRGRAGSALRRGCRPKAASRRAPSIRSDVSATRPCPVFRRHLPAAGASPAAGFPSGRAAMWRAFPGGRRTGTASPTGACSGSRPRRAKKTAHKGRCSAPAPARLRRWPP